MQAAKQKSRSCRQEYGGGKIKNNILRVNANNPNTLYRLISELLMGPEGGQFDQMKEDTRITRPKVIFCPVCKEAEIVDHGTSGKASHRCGTCGRYIEYDYDSMTAREIRPIKGLTKLINSSV